MRNKKFIVLAAVLTAALATAGIATAMHESGGVAGVSAWFNATTVVTSVQKTCTVTGGDTYTYTQAVYSGTSSSADARLNGPITIEAQSMTDDTSGIGAIVGDYTIHGADGSGSSGRIEASLYSGGMSGAVRGHASNPWGELFAGLNGTFSASLGFSGAGIGTSGSASTGVVLQRGACVRTMYLH
jgi:hypothetical protein